MLFMKLASRGRNTIEKLSILAIRINTNECLHVVIGAHETFRSVCEQVYVCVRQMGGGGVLIKVSCSEQKREGMR